MAIRVNGKLFAAVLVLIILGFTWAPIISFSMYAYESFTGPSKEEMAKLKEESDKEFMTFCDEWEARKGRAPMGCSNH